MRYFSIQNGLLFVGLQCSVLGCMSVPDEAPQEFHTARAALQRADKADVEDYLPATLDRAENEFKEAVSLWKKSKDSDVKKEERGDLLKTATEKAAGVQAMTEQAIQLQDQIKAWDSNIQSYTQMVQERQDALAQVKQLQDQQRDAAIASAQTPTQTTVHPDITLRGPVAYFGAGSTDVDSRYQDNINALARTLTADPTAKVTLSGFADPRGDKEMNDRLARERAEAVAAILREKGVSSNQIQVQAWPAASARGKRPKSQAQLQLDRRVEAYVTTDASRSMRGQGQPGQEAPQEQQPR